MCEHTGNSTEGLARNAYVYGCKREFGQSGLTGHQHRLFRRVAAGEASVTSYVIRLGTPTAKSAIPANQIMRRKIPWRAAVVRGVAARNVVPPAGTRVARELTKQSICTHRDDFPL